MLLAQKSYVEGALALNLYCSRLLDEQATAADDAERLALAQLLDILTPIAKSWPSQWGQESNSLAIQVLGGSGYTRDYDVEAHWRDQRLNPIHEGTHGIQALDLLGRKVLGGGGASLMALTARIEETVGRAHRARRRARAYALRSRRWSTGLGEVTLGLAGLGDPERTMANATVYLEAAGHIVIAWMWLEQLVAVGEKSGDFYDGKRAAARFFFRWELPKVAPDARPARLRRHHDAGDAAGLVLGGPARRSTGDEEVAQQPGRRGVRQRDGDVEAYVAHEHALGAGRRRGGQVREADAALPPRLRTTQPMMPSVSSTVRIRASAPLPATRWSPARA